MSIDYDKPKYVPHSSWYPHITQVVSNNFPTWTKLRLDSRSRGQQLITPLAQPLEYIDKSLVEMSDNQYLPSARLDELDRANIIRRPANVALTNMDLGTLIVHNVNPSGMVLTRAASLEEFYDAIPNRANIVELAEDIYASGVSPSGIVDDYMHYVDPTPPDVSDTAYNEFRTLLWDLDDIQRSLENGYVIRAITQYKDDLWLLLTTWEKSELWQISKRTYLPEPPVLKCRGRVDITGINLGYVHSIYFDAAGKLYIVDAEDRIRYRVDFIYDTYFADSAGSALFMRDPYPSGVYIYASGTNVGTPEVTEFHHIWNIFDDFGFLLALDRIPEESNVDYRERLLDVFINPAGAHHQGLLNGISRELGLDTYEIDASGFPVTPPSGARVVLQQLNASGYIATQLNADGSAIGTDLEKIVDQLEDVAPILWGKATWDLSFSDTISKEYVGIDYLPNLYDADASGFTSTEFKNGVGDNDDLKAIKAEGIDSSYINVVDPNTLNQQAFRLDGDADAYGATLDSSFFLISYDMYANYYGLPGNPANDELIGLTKAFDQFLYDTQGNYIV